MDDTQKCIEDALQSLPVTELETKPLSTLTAYVESLGFLFLDRVFDVTEIEGITGTTGLLITYKNVEENNGVYLLVIQADQSLALITVIPSTISNGTKIRRLVGELTDASTRIVKTPITPFEWVEITGQFLVNAVLKKIAMVCNIQEEDENQFITLYLPKFLADVAMYYTGAERNGKPVIYEELVNLEPLKIKELLKEGKVHAEKHT